MSFFVCCQGIRQDKIENDYWNVAVDSVGEPIGNNMEINVSHRQDTIRIYEQSEVDTKAVFPMSNAQFLKFYTENFKYPNIEPINGRGELDLVIDEKGNVVDVLIINSLHPELDKEFIRIMKLLPRFTQPGKLNGKSVCSKYRLPMSARAF